MVKFNPKRLAFSGSNGHQKASLSNPKRLAFSGKSTAPVHLRSHVYGTGAIFISNLTRSTQNLEFPHFVMKIGNMDSLESHNFTGNKYRLLYYVKMIYYIYYGKKLLFLPYYYCRDIRKTV